MHIKILFIALLACVAVFAQDIPAEGTTSSQVARPIRDGRSIYLDISLGLSGFRGSGGRINSSTYLNGTRYFDELLGASLAIDMINDDDTPINAIGLALNAKYPINPALQGYALGGLSYVYGADIDSTVGFFVEAGVRFLIDSLYIKAAAHYLTASSEANGEDINLNNIAIMGGVGIRF